MMTGPAGGGGGVVVVVVVVLTEVFKRGETVVVVVEDVVEDEDVVVSVSLSGMTFSKMRDGCFASEGSTTRGGKLTLLDRSGCCW